MANDVIVDSGLDEILKRLVGLSIANPLFCAVGAGSTAPDGSETTLGEEAVRVPVSTCELTGTGQMTIKSFFNTAQANGPVGEHGLFVKSEQGAPGDVLIDKGIEVPTQAKKATQEMIVEKVITLARG